MENLSDYERTYIDRLFIEYHELFKQKVDLHSKLILTEKKVEILDRDITDLANKFFQLKNLYDNLLVENNTLKELTIESKTEDVNKLKKGAK